MSRTPANIIDAEVEPELHDVPSPDARDSEGQDDPVARALAAAVRGGAAQRRASESELFSLVYEELRGIAKCWFRNQPLNHTLQPTALVHEAYLKIAEGSGSRFQDRTHLLATVARAMRQILVDHARRRKAYKRGGDRSRVQLESVGLTVPGESLDFEDLHQALQRLEGFNERQSKIVELRFFGGLTIEETARHLSVSPRTVKLDWQFARAWLLNECQRHAL